MFSLFPYLLALEGFSPLLLRLTIGIIFVYWGYTRIKSKVNSKQVIIGLVKAVVGLFFIAGFLTQLAAIASLIILLIGLIKKIRDKAFFTQGVNYYFILFIISLSLLITGPGFIAFDLPL